MKYTHNGVEIRLSRWFRPLATAYIAKVDGKWVYEIRIEGVGVGLAGVGGDNINDAIQTAKTAYRRHLSGFK